MGEGGAEGGFANTVLHLQAAMEVPSPSREDFSSFLQGPPPPPPCRDRVSGAQDLLDLAALPVVQRLRNRLSHLLSPSTASGDGLPTGGGDAWVKAARSMSARGEGREVRRGGR